jgi:pilus assembly protein CpaE
VVVEAEGYEFSEVVQRINDATLASQIENLIADVLIVDCSGAQLNQDIAALELLISINPNLVVVMLTQTRDADTLVAAMQAGVREVLLSPPCAADVTAALRRLAVRKKKSPDTSSKHAKTIAFMSCKAGSGATLLATNFADILAKDLGKKTAFLDLDLQCGDAAYYMSLGSNKTDIAELTQQIDRLDAKLLSASMLHIGPKFDLLSAPENPEASYSMTPLQLERLLNLVEINYDMVVLDLERVLTPLTIKALDMSDVVYLVMENLLPFVRDAKRLVSKLQALGHEDSKIRIVVNRYDDGSSIDVTQIEKVLGFKVCHTIPSSFTDVTQAINMGVPISEVNPNNAVVKVLRDMAHGFDDMPAHYMPSWMDRLMGVKG